MKRSRFTGEQIIGILKKQQAGLGTKDLCRKHGVSDATFYKWRSKYGGMRCTAGHRAAMSCPPLVPDQSLPDRFNCEPTEGASNPSITCGKWFEKRLHPIDWVFGSRVFLRIPVLSAQKAPARPRDRNAIEFVRKVVPFYLRTARLRPCKDFCVIKALGAVGSIAPSNDSNRPRRKSRWLTDR